MNTYTLTSILKPAATAILLLMASAAKSRCLAMVLMLNFLKQRGNYQTFVGLWALYSQEKFNNKTAISNTTVSEIIGNQNTLGAVPMAGIKYQSQYKIEVSAALRGIITSNTQAIQLVFGLALPL
jgi:hypothetical protein